ncbi:MAG: hypothetical protein WB788_03625 [Thermoplasmata archaeon]
MTNLLDSLENLEVFDGNAEIITYRGRRALHLSPASNLPESEESVLALVKSMEFRDGTIELQVAGAPRPGAPKDARGFIGLLFRVRDRGAQAENLYVRPTNGRADDQLRRNHSVQYSSTPDFPWHRLREENPGVYESYVDLDPGAWTKIKVTVSGTKAQLFVHSAAQPCLIVNDLKLGEVQGQIGVWAHASTEAYFSDLSVRSV